MHCTLSYQKRLQKSRTGPSLSSLSFPVPCSMVLISLLLFGSILRGLFSQQLPPRSIRRSSKQKLVHACSRRRMDRFLKPAAASLLALDKAGARSHFAPLFSSPHRVLQRGSYPAGAFIRSNLIQRNDRASMKQMQSRKCLPQAPISAPSARFAAGTQTR